MERSGRSLYELQFALAEQGLLDEKIATSYTRIIQMLAWTRYFDECWKVAQLEFNDDFAARVDAQRDRASAAVGEPTGAGEE